MSAPRITASALARVIACPASAALPGVHDAPGQYSERGTSIHRFLQRAVEIGRDAALDEIPADAEHRDTCAGIDVAALVQGAVKVEAEVAVAYNVETDTGRIIGTGRDRDYGELADGEIPGTADLVLTYADDGVEVRDYKSGHRPVSALDNPQLALLSLGIARARAPRSVVATIGTIFDDGSHKIDPMPLTPMRLGAAAERLFSARRAAWAAAQKVERGETPDVSPGDHCRYCPAKVGCPAHVALVRELAAAPDGALVPLLTGAQAVEQAKQRVAAHLAVVTPTQAGRAWVTLDVLEELLAHAREQLKVRVKADGGIPLPDGKTLVEQRSERETIEADLALPVLQKRLGDVSGIVEPKITKSAIERELRRRNGASSKGISKAVDEIMTVLRDAKAVKVSTQTRFEAK